MARTFVVVPAAGQGARFGAGRAKQYADLAGRPLLARTLDRLRTLPCDATLVALAPDDDRYATAVGERPGVAAVRCGGGTRSHTVRNALKALAGHCDDGDWVLVHDAARPCVPRDALERLVAGLADDPVGGLLAVPVADTLKRADGDAAVPRVLRTEDRRGLWQAQTPQMFRFRVLSDALERDADGSSTDEAQAVEGLAATGRCGMPRLVRGNAANIKVTFPEDLALAAAILRMQGDE
jgi:2-C-methyl-D-erythritol 4-phosphate cytidylyltransferase